MVRHWCKYRGACKDLCPHENACRRRSACGLTCDDEYTGSYICLSVSQTVSQTDRQTDRQKRVGVKKMADKETSESMSENVFMIHD